MPKIKTYQDSVKPQSLPTPYGRPQESGLGGLGQTIAAGASAVASELEEKAKAQQRLADTESRAFQAARVSGEAGGAYKEILELLENNETGYLRTEAGAALEGRDTTLKAMKGIFQRRLGQIKDPLVRQLVENEFQKIENNTLSRVYAHASGQAEVVKGQHFTQGAAAAADRALKAASADEREEAVYDAGHIAMAQAAGKGFGEKAIIEAGRLMRGEVNKKVIVSMVESQPANALAYMEQEDVAETLDEPFLETQRTIAFENEAKQSAKSAAQNAVKGAMVDDKGNRSPYINREKAIDRLKGTGLKGEDFTRARAELENLIKISEAERNTDIYAAYGRAYEAIVTAGESGLAGDLTEQVNGQDKAFLIAQGGEGNDYWQKLKGIAARYNQAANQDAAASAAASRAQAYNFGLIHEAMSNDPSAVIGMSWQEFTSKFSGLVSDKDLRRLWDKKLAWQRAVEAGDTAEKGVKIFDEIAQGKIRGIKPEQRIALRLQVIDAMEEREDFIRNTLHREPTYQEYAEFAHTLLVKGVTDQGRRTFWWDDKSSYINAIKAGQASTFTIDITSLDPVTQKSIRDVVDSTPGLTHTPAHYTKVWLEMAQPGYGETRDSRVIVTDFPTAEEREARKKTKEAAEQKAEEE